jgi:cytochrome c oxidase subunit 2
MSLLVGAVPVVGQAAQSVLAPAGRQAAETGHLMWWFLAILGVIWVLVMIATVAALAARSGVSDERRRMRMVTAGGVATGIVLFGLVWMDVASGRKLAQLAGPNPLVVEIVGHQWWWEITYSDPDPSQRMTTANELHLPTGQPVQIELRSTDVIHSLWIPNLAGKRDLIPGRPSRIVIQADRPGVYRGQCAEFCGVEHALMGLVVVVEPPPAFAAWIDAQRRPAPAPTTDRARHGRDLFVHGPCAMCHAVAGTDAFAKNGPDLSHIASRSTLAAGTVPNVRGYLAGWIIDSQHTKPGNNMPSISMPGEDLLDLVEYLETLR